MTFEEWFGNTKAFRDTKEFARKAWDAATAAANEACAVVAEEYMSPTTAAYAQWEPYTIGCEIAAAIRARGEDEQRD